MTTPAETCAKIRYRDELAAKLALLETSGRRRHTRRAVEESRAYRCGICGRWHLTSLERS